MKDRITQTATRGVNLQGAAEALDDLRQHIEIGVVRGEAGDDHFIVENGSVWVDVVLVPSEAVITCRLGAAVGGPGNGIWRVPPEGTEVVVVFPGGSIDGGGIIVCSLDSAAVPDGLDDSKVIIVAPDVRVYSSDESNAKSLLKTAEFMAHTHPDPASGFTGTPTVTVAGTTVFKAE